MSSPIKLRGIDHVVIRAAHPDKTIAFYRDVLGCTIERSLDIGLVQLRAGASLIDVVPVDSPLGKMGGGPPPSEGRNMDHFCLKLEQFDEGTIREHLHAHGIAAGAAERRYGADGYGPSIYLKDPEGNTVELKG
jgi:catechol 2,3-dioxygenase-like lactoylglutathione lyase family enzyme